MREKSSNKKPRLNSRKRAGEVGVSSPDAFEPGLSVIRENENIWDTSDAIQAEKEAGEKRKKIDEWSIKVLVDLLGNGRSEESLWNIVKASNQGREEIIDEVELRVIFDKVMATQPHVTISLAQLMSQEFPPARYVIEPFFEVGAVNMLSAPPNNWKSWFLFYFASCIAQGCEVFKKFPTEKCGILIVNEEDSHRSVQDRFKILRIDNPSLEIYFRIASGAKLTKEFVLDIINECKEKKLGLVMFDSLRSMHEADENDSTTMQAVMDMLKMVAREGITVIFTHHNRKKSPFAKGDDAEASRGSSAINAAISGYISLEEEVRETGKFVIIRHLKSKVGKKIDPVEVKIIEVDGTIEFNYEGEFKSGERKLNTSKEMIMKILVPGEYKTLNDFISLEVASKNVVRAALLALVGEGSISVITRKEALERGLLASIDGNPKEKLYALPSEESELVQQQFDDI